MTSATALWTGWLRRNGGPWQRVASAATEGEAWHRLMDAAAGVKVCDLYVARAGQTPVDRQPAGMRRGS